jgi:hypothetical protein
VYLFQEPLRKDALSTNAGVILEMRGVVDRQSGRPNPDDVRYENRIAAARKAAAERVERERREREQEQQRQEAEQKRELQRREEQRRADAERAKQERAREHARARERTRLEAFLRAHQAINNPTDDRQSQFLRTFLLNPFAYEGTVIALHGVLKNMVSPTEGIFLVSERFIDRWNTQEEFVVISGLPKGFSPPDGKALLVGEGLGKTDMVNGFGATVRLPHLEIVGLCIVSGQTEGVPSRTCRDVIDGREVIPAAVESVAVSPTSSTQPSTTLEAVAEPDPSPAPAPRDTRQEVPEQPQSPTVQFSAPTTADEYVQRMIRYAMSKDVADSEAKILTAKRDIEALNLKSQAVQRQRKKAREANDRGLQHLRRWEVPEAVQAFRTAVESDPADIEAMNNLGHAYLWQDDLPQAEAWLLRALTMAPGRSYAWADLGHIYAKQGEIAKGVACFANAYRFARNQDVSRRSFQGIADDEGQHAAVREAARQVLQLRLVQAHP